MIIDKIALTLAIIGGINWGSIGIFGFDFVAFFIWRPHRSLQPCYLRVGRHLGSLVYLSPVSRYYDSRRAYLSTKRSACPTGHADFFTPFQFLSYAFAAKQNWRLDILQVQHYTSITPLPRGVCARKGEASYDG